MTHRQRTIDYNPEDVQYLDRFSDELAMLTAMVREILVDEPKLLLSPVMRRVLSDKAALVESLHSPLRKLLAVDNLGDPLKPAKP